MHQRVITDLVTRALGTDDPSVTGALTALAQYDEVTSPQGLLDAIAGHLMPALGAVLAQSLVDEEPTVDELNALDFSPPSDETEPACLTAACDYTAYAVRPIRREQINPLQQHGRVLGAFDSFPRTAFYLHALHRLPLRYQGLSTPAVTVLCANDRATLDHQARRFAQTGLYETVAIHSHPPTVTPALLRVQGETIRANVAP